MQPITREDYLALLTPQERERLTTWKWAYKLHSEQRVPMPVAKRLAFAKYLYLKGRLVG